MNKAALVIPLLALIPGCFRPTPAPTPVVDFCAITAPLASEDGRLFRYSAEEWEARIPYPTNVRKELVLTQRRLEECPARPGDGAPG